ncbi:hypothetical protein [Paenibacillus sp. SN-8-1]|uniref:hypothetical protein n=1 Tax=Paenibacillus sp. SN-8-1 TaxID=3435409 RepID=UPI003D9A1077
MQNEELLMLAIIAAGLQVMIQFLGVIKALLEYMSARKKEKDSNRSQRSKSKRNKPR